MAAPMMKLRILPVFCCALLLLGSACTQHKQPSATVQPDAATVTPKPDKTATVAALPGLSADATRAMASTVTPLAPGIRVSRVQINAPYVALTFDDGPSAALTPKVLDILGRHHAQGTFFVLGQNASANRSILARAAAEGHELGVHTWSHIKMTSAGQAKIDSEVSRTSEVIRSVTGRSPKLMRPPYGATNKGIIAHMYNSYGMYSVLWDVDTLDWKHPGVQRVINTAVGQAKPGSIILVHDIHASTLAALEGIVTGLQARGFKIVTVSRLMALARNAAGAGEPAAAPVAPLAPVAPVAEPAAQPVAEPVVPVAPLAPVATVTPAAPVAAVPATQPAAPVELAPATAVSAAPSLDIAPAATVAETYPVATPVTVAPAAPANAPVVSVSAAEPEPAAASATISSIPAPEPQPAAETTEEPGDSF